MELAPLCAHGLESASTASLRSHKSTDLIRSRFLVHKVRSDSSQASERQLFTVTHRCRQVGAPAYTATRFCLGARRRRATHPSLLLHLSTESFELLLLTTWPQ